MECFLYSCFNVCSAKPVALVHPLSTFILLTFLYLLLLFFFSDLWTFYWPLASQGVLHFCCLNVSELWYCWPQLPLCHPQSCEGGLLQRLRRAAVVQGIIKRKVLPFSSRQRKTLPPAGPWCSADPLTGSGPANSRCSRIPLNCSICIA